METFDDRTALFGEQSICRADSAWASQWVDRTVAIEQHQLNSNNRRSNGVRLIAQLTAWALQCDLLQIIRTIQ